VVFAKTAPILGIKLQCVTRPAVFEAEAVNDTALVEGRRAKMLPGG